MAEEPSRETLELLGWAWKYVPGLVLAWQISGRESLLRQMQKIRDEGLLDD